MIRDDRPYHFDYEPETHSIVLIHGVRRKWRPQSIAVEVRRNTFFDRPPFSAVSPALASAFHVEAIGYEWRPGVLEKLPGADHG